MGEVYRARDTRLKRDVAIKVLPEAFSQDPDRLARLQREAELLATLNHPNIAAIHGLEDADGVTALVLELVEGPTLADRIAQGPVPLDEALPIAKQIAEALEAAHDLGIIHRDLKPANIKVRADGTVKVLDFGLAKLTEPGGPGRAGELEASQSPTITSPAQMTGVGVILGTAAYMAPEQAKGRAADKRADIWAFGVVLFEMLTGQRAFEGEDVAETLAHILTKEPDWSVLPAATPAALRRLLRRCLSKDRKHRLDSAADAWLEIEDASKDEATPATSSASAAPVPQARLPWAVAALATIAAAAAVALWAPWRSAPEPARVVFEMQTAAPGGGSPLHMFAISPDGTHVVVLVQDGDVRKLWVRPLARLEGVTLARTDGASYPFWSPDSRSVGFFADSKLKIIDISGTAPQMLADAQSGWGGTWNRDGVILFAPQDGPIYRVAASGEPVVPVTELDATRGDTSHRFPRFLPDGVHFLYLVISSRPESGGIYVGSLASTEAHRLVGAPNKPEFAPPDLLLFLRDRTLMAQQLDTNSSQIIGTPFRVVEPVLSDVTRGAAAFSVSDNGVLVYRTGLVDGARELAWVDRSGKREGRVGPPALYQNPRLSPDSQKLAVFKPEDGGDIWVIELESGNGTKLTLDPASDNVPVWSPDGTRIAFVSDRDGALNIYQKNAGGTGPEQLLHKTPNDKLLNDWSPNGQYLLYQEADPQTKKPHVWVLSLADRKASRLLNNPSISESESEATFSPDGRWIAYTSGEGNSRKVLVQKFPTADGTWQASSGGVGAHPRWGTDGKELFFDTIGTMAAVTVTVSGGREFRHGAQRTLFAGLLGGSTHNFDVADAGRRFLVQLVPGETLPIVVVVNWKTGLALGR